MTITVKTDWSHWLIEAGNLLPGSQIRIINVPSGLTNNERCSEMNKALRVAYPNKNLRAYWHGLFYVYYEAIIK